jgi:hypothetical protein
LVSKPQGGFAIGLKMMMLEEFVLSFGLLQEKKISKPYAIYREGRRAGVKSGGDSLEITTYQTVMINIGFVTFVICNRKSCTACEMGCFKMDGSKPLHKKQ